MNLKELFSLHTVRQKIVVTSKLAGAALILSYLFSTRVSDNPEVSLLIWLVFVIPLILGIDFLMGRFISDPVSRLNAAAERMAKLEFTEPCCISSKDEFEELFHSLNKMSENLRQTIAQLEAANIRLDTSNMKLEAANAQLDASNMELEAANVQLATDVEEKQRLLAERKDLTDSLSHEMKTPIGVIRAYAEGIQDETDEAKRQKYASIIIAETERMSNLITTLLDLSALEAGASSLAPEQLDLVELVEIEAGHLLADLPDAHFQLDYELPEEKIFVKTDQKRMVQVLDNLILNARNNVSPGGRLKLSLEKQKEALHFSIFNEGKNIPEESLGKVWTRFYRDPEAGYRGSGLGLSIVAQILSMQGLDYGVENMADGVIFYFSIPIVR